MPDGIHDKATKWIVHILNWKPLLKRMIVLNLYFHISSKYVCLLAGGCYHIKMSALKLGLASMV